MLEEIKHIKTGKKNLRNFGVIIGIILLIVAGFLFYREKESFQTFLYIAGVFIGLALILPSMLKPIYIVWMTFAVILGWFMTRVILSLLFYVIITPIGLVLRIFGKDFLELKKQAVQGSYWNQRDSNLEKNQNYEKQF
tara:strand:+ start:135 stop:548 length:414 start_codon:yes stop_codon:yes gene_type:complete